MSQQRERLLRRLESRRGKALRDVQSGVLNVRWGTDQAVGTLLDTATVEVSYRDLEMVLAGVDQS